MDVTEEEMKMIDSKIADAIKRAKMTGTAADFFCLRVYETIFNTPHRDASGALGALIIKEAEPDGHDFTGRRKLGGTEVYVELDELLRILTDPTAGPAVLARRAVDEIKVQLGTMERHRQSMIEMSERQRRNTFEMTRAEAWNRMDAVERAYERFAAEGDESMKTFQAMLKSERAGSTTPPPGWTPPTPPAPAAPPQMPDITFRPSTEPSPYAFDYSETDRHGVRREFDGPTRTEKKKRPFNPAGTTLAWADGESEPAGPLGRWGEGAGGEDDDATTAKRIF